MYVYGCLNEWGATLEYTSLTAVLALSVVEYGYFQEIAFCELPGDANHDILIMEERFITNCHKHGLMYVKADQTEENEFFCNSDTTVEFACFLDWLGDRVQLKVGLLLVCNTVTYAQLVQRVSVCVCCRVCVTLCVWV
jgi:hypothetical protein